MRTIEQAIRDRVEEKRQAGLATKREGELARARQYQRECKAARMFRAWLCRTYDLDLSSLVIKARDIDEDTHFKISIIGAGWRIDLAPVFVLDDEGDVLLLGSRGFRAVKPGPSNSIGADFSNFIDALIYVVGEPKADTEPASDEPETATRPRNTTNTSDFMAKMKRIKARNANANTP